jgi:hypothetical protein
MSGGRYESAMFWLAFGTAAAVIGLALMTIGVTRAPTGANLLASPWFDGGLILLGLGILLLLWALMLYARRRVQVKAEATAVGHAAPVDKEAEAVRGYYAERNKLIDIWERQERSRRRQKK